MTQTRFSVYLEEVRLFRPPAEWDAGGPPARGCPGEGGVSPPSPPPARIYLYLRYEAGPHPPGGRGSVRARSYLPQPAGAWPITTYPAQGRLRSIALVLDVIWADEAARRHEPKRTFLTRCSLGVRLVCVSSQRIRSVCIFCSSTTKASGLASRKGLLFFISFR